MHYAIGLRTSHKPNILQRHLRSSLLQLAIILVVMVPLLVIIGFSRINPHLFLSGFLASFLRVAVAYLISLVLALLLAFLITTNRVVENFLLPIFDVLQSFPSFALIPILATTLARSPDLVVVAVLVIAMVWPLLFGIIGGLKNRRSDLEEAATMFGAQGIRRFYSFTLPELFPSIMTGSIVSWGNAWDLLIGAELLVTVTGGVGRYLGALGQQNQRGLLSLGIVAYLLILFIINKIIWLPLLSKATRYQTGD